MNINIYVCTHVQVNDLVSKTAAEVLELALDGAVGVRPALRFFFFLWVLVIKHSL